jgi:hypothetical protein
MKIGLILPWTVILNEVKDLLHAFDHFETQNKQILRRYAPQNDTATKSPRPPSSLQPQFSKEVMKNTQLKNSKTQIFESFVSFVRFAVTPVFTCLFSNWNRRTHNLRELLKLQRSFKVLAVSRSF